MKLISIPSLTDNYIWLLYNNQQECIIVDPGDHIPVLYTLKKLNLNLNAIFLTHHHNDHTDGVDKLLKHYKKTLVFGPKETEKKGSNHIVHNEDNIHAINLIFKIISLPGHTKGHIGFYSHPWLFCGDTVFSAGCGKIFEGTKKQMYQSLQKIKKLNKNTLICSAHEYTLSNINFALSILPQDKNLIFYKNYIQNIQKKNKPTLPSILKHELKINLFFRCNDTILKNQLKLLAEDEEWKVFSKLREKKDKYKKR